MRATLTWLVLPWSMRFFEVMVVPLVLASVLGCGGSEGGSAVDGGPVAVAVDATAVDGAPPTTFGGTRPAELLVPSSYSAATPMPLVIALHGYSSITTYVTGVTRLAYAYETDGFLLIAPTGTLDEGGRYFWNATDACCNFYGSTVDDVAYLNGLIDEISAAYNVDPDRVFIVGDSNGGFMAFRMACASAGRFAAIAVIGGATFNDPGACAPSEPVSVLHAHGTDDRTIAYEGGSTTVNGTAAPYPSALGSDQRWAAYNGCATTATPGAPIDLIGDATAETTTRTYDSCPTGIDVESWTVVGGPHTLFITATATQIFPWLNAHPKR